MTCRKGFWHNLLASSSKRSPVGYCYKQALVTCTKGKQWIICAVYAWNFMTAQNEGKKRNIMHLTEYVQHASVALCTGTFFSFLPIVHSKAEAKQTKNCSQKILPADPWKTREKVLFLKAVKWFYDLAFPFPALEPRHDHLNMEMSSKSNLRTGKKSTYE